MGGAVKDFFAADIWKNSLEIAWVLLDQSLHFRHRSSKPLSIRVIERKASAADECADEAHVVVCLEYGRILVPTIVE